MKEFIRTCVVWALTMEARAIIRRYRPSIILVTGSVGKTSAKDAAFSALSEKLFVRKSEKSFNSDIGAPLTVLGVPNGWSNPLQWVRNIIDGLLLLLIRVPYPAWLIVEVGADRPGDISRSLAWLRPSIVIATRFPAVPVHVEFYESPEQVQQEELAPLNWLTPGAVAVINADDIVVSAARIPDGVDTISFGFSSEAMVRASRVKVLTEAGRPRGVSFDVSYRQERAHVVLEGAVGTAHIYAALAGIGAALAAGLTLTDAAIGFEKFDPPRSRMRLLNGFKGSTLVDDSYNASPAAVEEALKTLALLPRKGHRIAVLGDMLELGAYSALEHEKVGALAAESADFLITVGVRAKKIAESALRAGMPAESVLQFDRSTDAGEHLKSFIGAGDVVLLKGSQGIRMERAVKMLMQEPSTAKDLVCRQDYEWLAR